MTTLSTIATIIICAIVALLLVHDIYRIGYKTGKADGFRAGYRQARGGVE